MFDVSIVSALNAVGVFFVERVNVESLIVVKIRDKGGIFDYQQEFRLGFVYTFREPLMLLFSEGVGLVFGKIGIVGRIEKNKIPLFALGENAVEIGRRDPCGR